MTTQDAAPVKERQVFISYSWTNPDHEKWVEDLAKRLEDNGIHVHFDKWELIEGHDKFAFMESMVNSADIDKVLIICDKGYKEKANDRRGGVGTETQIMTPELYSKAKQEKFIPIIAERDENGKEYVPTFVASRLYIDFSSPQNFEDNFESLLRNIYQVRLHVRPPRGRPPAFLFDDQATQFKTVAVIRKMESAFEREPRRLKFLWSEFAVSFFESLEELNIAKPSNTEEAFEFVLKMIDKSLSLRDDYIKAFELMCQSESLSLESHIEFFEEFYAYTEGLSSYSFQYDQFKFLIREVLVYTIAILLKNRQYDFAAALLNSEYYIKSKHRTNVKYRFDVFELHIKIFELMGNSRNRKDYYSDELIKRVHTKFKTDFFIADLLIYYNTKIVNNDGTYWFPVTYVHFEENRIDLKFFNKLNSKRHFESVKSLFNVSTVEEMKQILKSYKKDSGYQSSFYSLPALNELIKPEEVASIP